MVLRLAAVATFKALKRSQISIKENAKLIKFVRCGLSGIKQTCDRLLKTAVAKRKTLWKIQKKKSMEKSERKLKPLALRRPNF